MTADLLPCPFCGGSAERIDFGPGSGDNDGGSCIACTKCQSSGPVEFGYKENFVSNWNHRALSRAAGQDVEVRKGCGDPECGCDKPTFTEPMEAIRFLAGRLEFAGVSDAVAKSYALDLRNILRTHPAVARSEGEES